MKKYLSLIALVSLCIALVPLAGAQNIAVTPTGVIAEGDTVNGAESQQFRVFNTGSGNAFYVITDPVDWLSVSPASGSVSNESDLITISYSIGSLGTFSNYFTTITVTQTNGTPQTQTVSVALSKTVAVSQGGIVARGHAEPASAIAIGNNISRALALGVDTVQIGDGINTNPASLKLFDTLLFQDGKLLAAALPDSAVQSGSISFSNNFLVAASQVGTNQIYSYRTIVVISNRLISISATLGGTNSF